jgi:hypothetical protein
MLVGYVITTAQSGCLQSVNDESHRNFDGIELCQRS